MKKNIDWSRLGFHYTETDTIVRSHYKDGRWSKPYLTQDKTINLHLSATCLHYGQEAFEGLKAFRGADGKIRIFRMNANAERLWQSAIGLAMAPVPTSLFREAVLLALSGNIDYLPPYETGATLYFRPLLIGTSPRLGVGTAQEYEFVIIPSPIGAYFKDGFRGTPFIIDRTVDRAAPLGTGRYKVGGNYAASFRATEPAHKQGLSVIFVDSVHRKYIDECGAANFFGVKDGVYITPASTSILPSITNDSLMTLCKEVGIPVERRPILVEELGDMSECGAVGTAAVIAPISLVIDPDTGRTYTFGEEPGQVSKLLYKLLQDIQYGRSEDKHGWCDVIDN
ncbi:MAG: branched-chain amino acid aminotransferase [Paludibacteraceae bacterium]|nr:branched-chain amino acid aminotransferase [Paludibacteraceae bacterium]MBR1786922.1 branched-chain amino acid aminotransferase [Paludibacteraceae bacterium]